MKQNETKLSVIVGDVFCKYTVEFYYYFMTYLVLLSLITVSAVL